MIGIGARGYVETEGQGRRKDGGWGRKKGMTKAVEQDWRKGCKVGKGDRT